jgi:hypothetical protein
MKNYTNFPFIEQSKNCDYLLRRVVVQCPNLHYPNCSNRYNVVY